MMLRIYLALILAVNVHGAPGKQLQPLAETDQLQGVKQEKGDLKTASSSYSHQYSNWGGRNPGGYELSVTGYGILDDRLGANYADVGGYNNVGYGGSPGYGSGYGVNNRYDSFGQRGYESGATGGYGLIGGYQKSDGFIGNNALAGSGYSGNAYGGNVGYGGSNGYSPSGGYGGSSGYNPSGGYGANSGYNPSGGYGGYASSNGFSGTGVYGNGGYGGYGGNGGLTSYYGYNNPYYQGNNHLGYGYYNKRPGYGNIYNNGITPSLVTGYRGYSR